MTPEQIAEFVVAFWSRVLANGNTAAQDLVAIREPLDTLDLAFWSIPLEGGNISADMLRVIAAVMSGKSIITATAPDAATVEFRAADDSEVRVTADMNGSERTAVTLNVD